MIYRQPSRHVSAYDDDWEDIPTSGPIAKWLGGVIVPLVLVGHGVFCFINRHGVLTGDGTSLDLYGPRAVALGIVTMSAGLFLHSHYFWGNIFHLAPAAVLGKLLSLLGVIGGLGYLIVQVGLFGRT